MSIKKIFPLLESLEYHTPEKWRGDIIAGLIVAVMLIPQGMAYAQLSGMPPIYGLYGGLFPLLVYGLLGTSRQLAIGPVAISSLLLVSTIGTIAEPLSAEYIAYVLLAGLLIGVYQAILGFLKIGFLVNFISQPVLTGFTAAVSIIIFVSQLKGALGLNIPRLPHWYQTVAHIFAAMQEVNIMAILFSLMTFVIITIMKKMNQGLFSALVVVVLGILASWGLTLYGFDYNLKIVGNIPAGLPAFTLPTISWDTFNLLIPATLAVGTMGVVECIGIAKVLESRHDDYRINPNQELIAIGLSKIAGSFFQAIPTSGSFSRSAVNDSAGASSGISSITTAIIIGLTLQFFTELFYYLPTAVLSTIIMLAIVKLIDLAAFRYLMKNYKIDFWMAIATFVVTLSLGIAQGVLAGVVLSLAVLVYKSSRPHIVTLGKLSDKPIYRNIERYETATCPEEVLIIRIDNQLYFGNALFFQEKLERISIDRQELDLVILDASGIHDIDSMGMKMLRDVHQKFQKNNIQFVIAEAIGPVRDIFSATGMIEFLGKEAYFLSVHDAMIHFGKSDKDAGLGWSSEALQHN